MKLLVHELRSTLLAHFQTGRGVRRIAAVRPHLVRIGSPAGSVYLEIRDAEDALIATSETRTIAGMGSGGHWHGYATFQITAHLKGNTAYRLVLVSTGYAFNESDYLGWANGFSLGKYPATYTAANPDWSAPLDFELWKNCTIQKGVT